MIWAIGLYGAFLFIQLAPLFFWNLGNKALYDHLRHKIALSALGFSAEWPSLDTSRVQVERISFIPKPVHLSLFSLPLHSSLFVLCFETCFHKILYLFRHPLNADLSFCKFSHSLLFFQAGSKWSFTPALGKDRGSALIIHGENYTVNMCSCRPFHKLKSGLVVSYCSRVAGVEVFPHCSLSVG